MGDTAGEPRGGFILFDQELKIQGAWSDERAPFGYDFWYQPQRHVMVSSGWGAPASFSRGFDPKDLSAGRYANGAPRLLLTLTAMSGWR
jgi:selenium-binding protein 1